MTFPIPIAELNLDEVLSFLEMNQQQLGVTGISLSAQSIAFWWQQASKKILQLPSKYFEFLWEFLSWLVTTNE